MKTKAISIILSAAILFSFFQAVPVFANSEKSGIDSDCAKNIIDTIAEDLIEGNSSIFEELEKFSASLQIELNNESNECKKIQINRLIAQTQENIGDYQRYQEFITTKQDGVFNRGVYDPTYTAAVLAIVAYFNYHGFLLSAELLTHAMENDNYMSDYYPIYGYRVTASPVYNQIINSGSASGTGVFNLGSTEILNDLYYSIHLFSYNIVESYGGNIFCLYDPYDYAKGNLYTGFAQAAVDTMYGAQMLDVIVPFMTRIELEY